MSNGIRTITDIELSFQVYDFGAWPAESIAQGVSHLYPYGKENASVFVREAQPGDMTLIDNDILAVIVTGFSEGPAGELVATLYLSNKTDRELSVTIEDAWLDEVAADPLWAVSLLPGKSAFSTLTWASSLWDASGKASAGDIQEIRLTIRAYDATDWTAPDLFQETVTVRPWD